MRSFYQSLKSFIVRHVKMLVSTFVGIGVATASYAAQAAITMPTLPTDDLETAGTAVLGLTAVAVVIGVIVRTLKKA